MHVTQQNYKDIRGHIKRCGKVIMIANCTSSYDTAATICVLPNQGFLYSKSLGVETMLLLLKGVLELWTNKEIC